MIDRLTTLFRLPSLLQEQRAQILRQRRLQGAKRWGVYNSVAIFRKTGIFPAFDSNYFFLLLFLIKLLRLTLTLIINVNVNLSRSIYFSEFLRFSTARSFFQEKKAQILNRSRHQAAKVKGAIPTYFIFINLWSSSPLGQGAKKGGTSLPLSKLSARAEGADTLPAAASGRQQAGCSPFLRSLVWRLI